MKSLKTKWIAYTVLVGLIPIFLRLLIWLVTKEGSIEAFSPQDFIAFGLVLHISNINEVEHIISADGSWKTVQNSVSSFFITIHGALFCLTLIGGDAIDQQAIMYGVVLISLASLSISYSLFKRIEKLPLGQAERTP